MMNQTLDEKTGQAVCELLVSIGQALEHLRGSGNAELRQLVADGRRQAVETLESAIPCPLDALINTSELSDENWLRTMYLIVGEFTNPFRPKNRFDREFMELLEFVWSRSETELLAVMKNNLKKLKEDSRENYDSLVDYFARFPL